MKVRIKSPFKKKRSTFFQKKEELIIAYTKGEGLKKLQEERVYRKTQSVAPCISK